MPNLNVFLLFEENSNVPIAYFRSREAADKTAKYLINNPITRFTNIRVEIATLKAAQKAIESWRSLPVKGFQIEADSIMWQQNQIRSNRLAAIVDSYFEARSEFDSTNVRSNSA